jgi:hypothetical protein
MPMLPTLSSFDASQLNFLCTSHLSMHTTFAAHLTFPDLITLLIFG